jgi:hypothetical protein
VLRATPACGSAGGSVSSDDPASPLVEQHSIALPDVVGRIDHRAVDVAHHLVFIAELGMRRS